MVAVRNQIDFQLKPTPRKIQWNEFKNRYLNREDKFKYEWVNGEVEKMTRSMDRTQIFILHNLLNFFFNLKFSRLSFFVFQLDFHLF